MSCFVKKMPLPSSCNVCPLLDWDLDAVKCKITGTAFRCDFPARNEWIRDRAKDCPITEVPEEHDDLIERPSDNLIKKCDKALLREYFRKIPAFIPAEGRDADV